MNYNSCVFMNDSSCFSNLYLQHRLWRSLAFLWKLQQRSWCCRCLKWVLKWRHWYAESYRMYIYMQIQFILPEMSRNNHRSKYYRVGMSDFIQYCGFWTFKSLWLGVFYFFSEEFTVFWKGYTQILNFSVLVFFNSSWLPFYCAASVNTIHWL